MDFQSKKMRVQGQTYAVSLREQQAGLGEFSHKPASVDGNLLDLFKSLNYQALPYSSFSDLLADHVDMIGYDIRKAFVLISERDGSGLDLIAQKLSQNALKVGAVKILSSAIEMQSLARIGDFSAAEKILGELEIELHAVREVLS